MNRSTGSTWAHRAQRAFFIGGWGLLAGCVNHPPAGVVDDCAIEMTIPSSVFTDILFVIDNSRSMQEEQEKVAADLETLVAALFASPAKNDFQVGVVTTTISTHSGDCDPTVDPVLHVFPEESGRLQRGKDLEGNVVDPTSPKILHADDPDLLEAFRALIQQGVDGPGQEMGLEAAARAVTPPLIDLPLDGDPPGNAGFLRAGAQLLIVIVSDEDDCSDPTQTAVVIEPVCGNYCDEDAECPIGYFCLRAPSGTKRCQRNSCETPEARAALEPVSKYVNLFRSLDDGTGDDQPRDVYLAVVGAVDPDDPTVPARCDRGGTEAHGSGVRYVEAVRAMGDRGFVDSICRESYGGTLEALAALINTPQVLDLVGGPIDGRLLQIVITRPDGSETICREGEGFTYRPPHHGPAGRVTLQGDCRVSHGDKVRAEIYCAD